MSATGSHTVWAGDDPSDLLGLAPGAYTILATVGGEEWAEGASQRSGKVFAFVTSYTPPNPSYTLGYSSPSGNEPGVYVGSWWATTHTTPPGEDGWEETWAGTAQANYVYARKRMNELQPMYVDVSIVTNPAGTYAGNGTAHLHGKTPMNFTFQTYGRKGGQVGIFVGVSATPFGAGLSYTPADAEGFAAIGGSVEIDGFREDNTCAASLRPTTVLDSWSSASNTVYVGSERVISCVVGGNATTIEILSSTVVGARSDEAGQYARAVENDDLPIIAVAYIELAN